MTGLPNGCTPKTAPKRTQYVPLPAAPPQHLIPSLAAPVGWLLVTTSPNLCLTPQASCTHSDTDVVLKAYNLMGLSTFLRHQVLRELDIHARLHHPSIVHLIAAFKVRSVLCAQATRAAAPREDALPAVLERDSVERSSTATLT